MSPAKWLKTKAPALSGPEHSRLAKKYSEAFNKDDHKYYAFVHRTCKEYKQFILDNNILVDELHSKRDALLASAISQVFCQIPAFDRPHAGNIQEAKIAVIDVVEHVFEMPHAGHMFGSPGWIKDQCRRPREISFDHAVKFLPLLHRLVRHLIKIGGDHGFPLLQPGEHVPHLGVYHAHDGEGRTKGCKKAHKQLPFLNVSSVTKAITDLKDLGYYPVRCMKDHMPSGQEWNNFGEVLYVFWIFYCKYEGITRTQDLARIVLIYIFFALLTGPRGKKWPVVRYIHRLVTNGRHRFASTTSLHFGELFKLMEAHPHLQRFLTDKGEGDVPVEYNAAVENGLRSHGCDLHAMGTNAMRSADDWSAVRKWMKREAYIAAARHKMGRSSYPQWDHFSWSDYVERQTLTATFEKRHLPLSTGNHPWPDKLVVIPESWSQPHLRKTKPKKVSRASRKLTASAKAACDVQVSCPEVMIFDKELGKLVAISSSSDTETDD